MLRKIFGPVRVGNDRIRTNRELYVLLNDMNVAKPLNMQRLRWLGHVVRMDKDTPSRPVFVEVVGVHPCKDQVKEALTLLGVFNWSRRLERSFKAGRNPIMGLFWPHK